MSYVVAVLVGYLLGCINPAYFIAKMKGFDIRTRGSMSAGASNAKITMGWPYFFIVLAYDLLKSLVSVLIIRHFFPGNETAAILAGVCAVVGHILPFYLQFKGGKGFASFIGLMAAVNWKIGLIIVIIGLIGAFATNWIVTCTLTCIIAFPIAMAIFTDTPKVSILLLLVASAMIIYKHIPNFKKLKAGKEIGINKCYVGTKIKADSH